MTTSSHARGFTLIEMAVSILAAAILVAGGVAVMNQQRRMLQNSSADRALQETARTALNEIGENLRRAAFGVEPSLAFDFGRATTTGPVPYKCADGNAVLCRDSITGSDEIVFYARDPAFKVELAAAPTGELLTLKGGIQTPLRRGQILEVMCANAESWAYVTVAAAASVWSPPAAAPASTTVTLQEANADGSFPKQNATLAESCFRADWAKARVYRVDRFRYYVQTFQDPNSPLTRPYLMLDRGLEDDNGSDRSEPVAPDVEDVQFGYVFWNPTTKATRSVGTTEGTRLTNSTAGIDVAAAAPKLDSLSKDPARLTNSPANIRAVRVAVVVRSPGPDITKIRPVTQRIYSEGPSIPAAGNRPAIVDASRANDSNFSHHVRIEVESTFEVRNMDSRAVFFDP